MSNRSETIGDLPIVLSGGLLDVRTGSGRRLTLVLLATAVFVLFLDTTIVNIGLDAIRADLGASLPALQWVVDAYTVALAMMLLVSGVVVDRYGARRPLAVGIALFTVASVLAALAPTAWMLILARGIQGVGASVVAPASLSLITKMYSDAQQRANAIAVWSAVSAVALACGPVVGAVLVHQGGWRAVFWINVPLGALVCAGLLFLRAVPSEQRREEQARSLDVVGQLMLTVGVGLMLVALIEAPRWGYTDPWILASAALGALALVWLLRRGTRVSWSLIPTRWVTRGDVAAILCAGFVTFLAIYAVIFLVPLLDQQYYGLSVLETALACTPLTVAMLITGLAAGWLSNRLPPLLLVASGLIAMTGGLILLAGLRIDPGSAWRALAMVLVGIGSTLALTPGTIALMTIAGDGRAGLASSMSNLVRNIGAAAGVALAGLLAHALTGGATGGETFLLGSAGSLALIGIICAASALPVFLLWRSPRRTPPGPSTTTP